MSIFRKIGDFVLGEEKIIIWDRDESPDKNLERGLVYRAPNSKVNDMRLVEKFGVRDYERALFYSSGQLHGVLEGGLYELDKQARNPATEIVWVDTGILQIPWGVAYFQQRVRTSEGFPIGMNGTQRFRVNDPSAFISKVVAYKKNFTDESTKEWISSLFLTSLADIVKNYTIKNLIGSNREDINALIRTKMAREFQIYGLELTAIDILGFAWPKEFDEEINKILYGDINNIKELDEKIEDHTQRLKKMKTRLEDLKDQWAMGDIDDLDYEKKRARLEQVISERESELKGLKAQKDRITHEKGYQN